MVNSDFLMVLTDNVKNSNMKTVFLKPQTYLNSSLFQILDEYYVSESLNSFLLNTEIMYRFLKDKLFNWKFFDIPNMEDRI